MALTTKTFCETSTTVLHNSSKNSKKNVDLHFQFEMYFPCYYLLRCGSIKETAKTVLNKVCFPLTDARLSEKTADCK